MRKKLKSLAILSLMSISLTSVASAAGGCSAWITSSVGSPFCSQERCGIWDSTALVQIHNQYRNCVGTNGNSYTQYQSVKKHIDCGC